MRVLFVVGGSHVAGLEIVMLDAMQGFMQRGAEVRCLASGWNDGDFVGRLNDRGIRAQTIKLGYVHPTQLRWTLDTVVHMPAALAGAVAMRASFRPDLVWFVSPRNVLQLSALFAGTPQVMHYHDDPASSLERRLLARLLVSRLEATVAISEWVRDRAIEAGVPAERVHRVWNGVAIERALVTREPHPVPVIGVVGQLIPNKGHEILFQSLARLAGRGRDFRCLVFGRGEQKERLQERVQSLGLGERVRFAGFERDRGRIYEQIDIAVVPSVHQEPFGLVAAEPGAFRLPVIASATGGLRDIVVDGVSGFLVPPSDVEALADKIERLLIDGELRRRFGEAGHRIVQERFSREAMADALVGVAQRAIQSSAAAR